MKAVVYQSHHHVHDMFLRAMFESCPFPVQWVTDQKPRDGTLGVVWGMKKEKVPASWWRADVARAHDQVIIMDSGYIHRGDGPENYQSVGLNGLNGTADFRNKDMSSDRWESLGREMKPWREDGSHVLLIGQVPWDASVQFQDHRKWLQEAVYELQRHTDREIRFRPHPKAWQHLPPLDGATYSKDSLEYDLKDCWCAVTYNSNTGVDAILEGIPVIAMHGGSMVYDVAMHRFDCVTDPVLLDRTQWANDIAYAQWRLDEMQEGLPWKHLFP